MDQLTIHGDYAPAVQADVLAPRFVFVLPRSFEARSRL
jgi:hypothetical protein